MTHTVQVSTWGQSVALQYESDSVSHRHMLNNIETNVAASSRYQKIVSSVSMDESIQNSITGVLSSRPHRDERSRRDLSALWAWPWPWHESGKLQWVERAKFRCLRARLSRFSRGWPQKGHFGPFLGPGGSRADPKTPIWPPRKNHS